MRNISFGDKSTVIAVFHLMNHWMRIKMRHWGVTGYVTNCVMVGQRVSSTLSVDDSFD